MLQVVTKILHEQYDYRRTDQLRSLNFWSNAIVALYIYNNFTPSHVVALRTLHPVV